MREICRVLGKFFLGLAVCLLVPLGVSILYEYFLEPKMYVGATWAFLETIGVSLICSLFFTRAGRNAKGKLYRKESIFLVAIIWFITAAMGSLPFIFTGTLKNPIDAYFESMSGLTTTGVSILHPKAYDPSTGAEIPIVAENPIDPTIVYTFSGTIAPLKDPATGVILAEGIEALGKPLLFWRCFMEWVGGMGIVVLFIAILPALGMGGKMLFESEMSGPSKEGMTPRIRETASLLWKIYVSLTCIQVIFLIFTNTHLSFFDAVTLSFSTISTGGFTVHSSGIMGFQSAMTQTIIVVFMILGSLNFTLYFHTLRGKFYRLYEPEFYLYLIVLIGGCLLMSWNLWNTPKDHGFHSLSSALAHGSFQAISAVTSTGFYLSNYDLWPYTCQLLILILMYIGGMSGSTTGGIKIARYVIILKVVRRKIESLFRPELVRTVQMGEREISDKMAITTLTFFCVVVAIVILGSYLLIMDHNDPQTALGVISCMINNNSLLLGGTGAFGSFAFLTDFSKIVSIFSMALGRLEYFSLLVLFVPAFWKRS